MVSMADSQSPCSSSSRIHNRSHGRSMRTIRSTLYTPSSTSFSEIDPPNSNSTPAGFSENLTDSVVDFRLSELAAAISSSSKNASFDAAASSSDLLDDSFSDYSSSFNSDISGELRRLALSHHHDNQSDSSPRCRQDHNQLTSLNAIAGDCETLSLDMVEPIVRSCIRTLTDSAADAESKCDAAARVRMLAKHRSDFRALMGSLGANEALIPYLKSADPATQENAVTALLNLSLEQGNKMPITSAGAIKPLIYAMRTGTATAKQNAACALLSLSMIEDNRMTMGVLGAIPPLISLLVHGSSRGKKDALTTLYKLCSVRPNKERAVRAGAVGPLIGLVGEHGNGIAEKAMVVLSSLAGFGEGRAAIVEEGGIQVLVEAIEDGPSKGKEFAVVTLLQLCSESMRNRGLLVREGAIPPLVALSQSGSARAKHKAETLLGYLREQRQDGASTGVTR